MAGQSNCICILDIIWSGYVLKTLKPEITCLQAITIYSALWMGKWCLDSWREVFISFQLLQGRDSDSSSNSVIPMGLYVWPQIDHGVTHSESCLHISHSCLHSFRGQRLRYIISGIQLPAISWMIFSSDFLRCAPCTLPFHIISWHFHPSTGNVSNFVWTHQNTYSNLSFLSLWYQRTFENKLNTKWVISLLLNKRGTSNSPETLCGWA